MGAASVEVRFIAEQSLVGDLNRLRELLSHKNPSMSLAEVIAKLAKIALAELDPDKRRVKKPALQEQLGTPAPERKRQMDPKMNPKTDPKPQSKPSPRSRYIPIKLKHAIFERDGYQCTYTDPLTDRRCGSRF